MLSAVHAGLFLPSPFRSSFSVYSRRFDLYCFGPSLIRLSISGCWSNLPREWSGSAPYFTALSSASLTLFLVCLSFLHGVMICVSLFCIFFSSSCSFRGWFESSFGQGRFALSALLMLFFVFSSCFPWFVYFCIYLSFSPSISLSTYESVMFFLSSRPLVF